MTLMRRIPRRGVEAWRPIGDLQSEINRLFGSCGSEVSAAASSFAAVDVMEQDDKILIRADLPGIKREDIQVTVHEGVLTLRGKREHSAEVKDDSYSHFERSVGTFSRSVQLPSEVDREKVTATYKDGVLEIEAPKLAEALPRTVEVNVN